MDDISPSVRQRALPELPADMGTRGVNGIHPNRHLETISEETSERELNQQGTVDRSCAMTATVSSVENRVYEFLHEETVLPTKETDSKTSDV